MQHSVNVKITSSRQRGAGWAGWPGWGLPCPPSQASGREWPAPGRRSPELPAQAIEIQVPWMDRLDPKDQDKQRNTQELHSGEGRLGVGGHASLDLHVRTITCSQCLSAEHTMHTNLLSIGECTSAQVTLGILGRLGRPCQERN